MKKAIQIKDALCYKVLTYLIMWHAWQPYKRWRKFYALRFAELFLILPLYRGLEHLMVVLSLDFDWATPKSSFYCFIFQKLFRGALPGVFWISILLQNSKYTKNNWALDQFMVPIVMVYHPDPKDQTIILSPTCLTVTRMFILWKCVLFMPDATLSRRFPFVSFVSVMSLGDHLDVIWERWDSPWSSFLSAMVFALQPSDFPVPVCWITNNDPNWSKWGLQSS